MILKLIIKHNKKLKKNQIIVWIQKNIEFEDDINQMFQFFKDNIQISEKRRLHTYYKVKSDNPAIMMSLFSAVHDIIPDIYFNDNDLIETAESLDLENF